MSICKRLLTYLWVCMFVCKWIHRSWAGCLEVLNQFKIFPFAGTSDFQEDPEFAWCQIQWMRWVRTHGYVFKSLPLCRLAPASSIYYIFFIRPCKYTSEIGSPELLQRMAIIISVRKARVPILRNKGSVPFTITFLNLKIHHIFLSCLHISIFKLNAVQIGRNFWSMAKNSNLKKFCKCRQNVKPPRKTQLIIWTILCVIFKKQELNSIFGIPTFRTFPKMMLLFCCWYELSIYCFNLR